MLNKIFIALGLLVGSVLAALGASNTLSGLQSGGPITNTDLFYDVQTVGVGGVKVTGSQFLSYVFGNVSGSCLATGVGVFTCNSIAAGTNITTSGSGANTTINVVATPSFTSVIATGNLTAATVVSTGNLTATTAQFSGQVTGTTAVFQTVTVNNLTPTGPNCVQETGGVLQATNSTCGGGGGTPGGSNLQVQFNNNNAFAGDPGFTYTTPAIVLLTSGTIVTSVKSLNISQGWNSAGVSFDAPLFVAATGTFAMPSMLADMQVAGTTIFAVGIKGGGGPGTDNAIWMGAAPSTSNWILSAVGSTTTNLNSGGQVTINVAGTPRLTIGGSGQAIFGSVVYYPEGTAVFGIANNSVNTNPSALRVYNTTDQTGGAGPTNYERGILDWTTPTNQFTVGTQAGGTGLGRNVVIVASNTRAQTISTTATTFAAALNAPAIAQLSANTTGYVCWTTSTGAISEDSVTCLASLRKLKKDIQPFGGAVPELMALKPSTFEWKSPADHNQQGQQLGFIAEDVAGIDRRLSSFDGNGELHGWRQDSMLSLLVAGFQEQQRTIAAQQQEINELKARLH